MTHKYYEEDFDMGNESRLKYFDDWFKIYSKQIARENGVTLSSYLSQIKDFTSFKAVIQEVFSLDGSLANYVSGMSERSLRIFYERSIVQEIVEATKEEDQEFFDELKEQIPVDVKQTDKEVEEFFKATFIEKETGKTKRVIAKKEIVKVKGKDMVRHRDSKGRFVKKT